MFRLGVFGGTYFRPIYSSIAKKDFKYMHKKYKFLQKIPNHLICAKIYNKDLNYYKVKCGTTLEFWEEKKWIKPPDYYGWIQWWCEFHNGRRIKELDKYQIK